MIYNTFLHTLARESLLGSIVRPQANTSVIGHRPRFCSIPGHGEEEPPIKYLKLAPPSPIIGRF